MFATKNQTKKFDRDSIYGTLFTRDSIYQRLACETTVGLS